MLIPFFTRHYFLEILRGVEEAASGHDYGLNIYNVERPEQAISHLQFLTRTRRVDALIVVALDGGMLAPALPADPRELPIVAVDTTMGPVPTIEVDYEEGMYAVVRHLLARGHERIALIDRSADPVTETRTDRRRCGYERALRDARIDVDPHLIVTSEYSADGGRAAVGALLEDTRPTAFACASDLQALGALQAAREAGLTVPGDVAITGFNDVEIAAYVGLTTVRVSAREMGRMAFDFGIALLNPKPDRRAHSLIPASLIVRDTS